MSQVYNLEPPTQGKVRWAACTAARGLPAATPACTRPNCRCASSTKLCCFLAPQVVLRTTLGDLDIELWPKEAPKAVRNFVQLCMEGYYDGTIFHRMIKDFMVQGGCWDGWEPAHAAYARLNHMACW